MYHLQILFRFGSDDEVIRVGAFSVILQQTATNIGVVDLLRIN